MAYDEELAERVRWVLSEGSAFTEKKMFGGIGFMLEGHMAVGVSGQGGLMLRVPPERTEELLDDPAAAPFEMRGKGMTGWLRIAADSLGDDAGLRRWVGIGVDYVRTLPPK